MFVTHDLGVLNMADAVEELEQVALRRIEGQVSDIKSGRGDLDRLGFTWGARLRARV